MALFFKADAIGIPPLFSAVMKGDLPNVEHIIDSDGTDPNLTFGQSRETALHYAAKTGDVKIIDALLSRGADININSFSKDTPLSIACFYCQEEAAMFLIEKNCDLTETDYNPKSPLMIAVTKGLNTVTHALLDYDVSYNDRRRRNVLHHAVIARNLYAIKMMRQKKILKRLAGEPDRLGAFPLHMACRKGYLDVVTQLLSAGADPNVEDPRFQNCQTPLQDAIINGYLHIVQELLAHGARLDYHLDAVPNFPLAVPPVCLSLMTNHEREDILQVLLEEGASVNAPFRNHLHQMYTSLHLAVDQDYYHMAKMIVLANCDLLANKRWLADYKPEDDDPNTSPERKEFFVWLEGFLNAAGSPNRLSYWCRNVIRNVIGERRPIATQINGLPLPPKLIKFLLFRDVQ